LIASRAELAGCGVRKKLAGGARRKKTKDKKGRIVDPAVLIRSRDLRRNGLMSTDVPNFLL